MEEIWKDVEGYEGLYQVSNLGKVRSIDREVKTSTGFRKYKGMVLKQRIVKEYLYVNFGTRSTHRVHRLIAKAFVPNPDNLPEVNHIDGNKLNNNIDNLEWCTSKENINHSWGKGLSKSRKGEKTNLSKLKEGDVLEIRRLHKTKKYKLRQLGAMFNVSEGCVSMIVNKLTWKHI